MRILLFLWSFLFSTLCFAETSTYVVQSSTFTDVYGSSVVESLRNRLTGHLKVMYVRDFSDDVSTQTKSLTGVDLGDRASKYDNLVVLGFDESDFKFNRPSVVYVPVYHYGGKSKQVGDLVKGLMDRLDTSASTSAVYQSTVHIFCDTTDISTSRYGTLKQALTPYKYIQLVQHTVKTDYDVRKILLKLSERKYQPTIIINNIFKLYSSDSGDFISLNDIDRLFVVWNSKHFEVGMLHDNTPIAFTVGYYKEDIAEYVVQRLNNKHAQLLPKIKINLDRVQQLGLKDTLLDNIDAIDLIEASPYEH